MNAVQTATVALKLLGVYVLVQGLHYIPVVWFNFGDDEIVSWTAIFVLFLLVATILFFAAEPLGRLLFAREGEAAPRERTIELQTIAFSVIGVWIGFLALARLTRLSHSLWATDRSEWSAAVWAWSGGSVVVLGALIALALSLFFRGQGLVVLFRKLFGPGDHAPSLPDKGGVQPPPAQAVAFSVLATYFFLRGLLTLADVGSSLVELRGSIDLGAFVDSVIWGQGLTGVVEVLFGLLLFRKSRALSVFWQRIQLA